MALLKLLSMALLKLLSAPPTFFGISLYLGLHNHCELCTAASYLPRNIVWWMGLGNERVYDVSA